MCRTKLSAAVECVSGGRRSRGGEEEDDESVKLVKVASMAA
ncbi:hypothetical protein SOVF_134340 [Spinacia oleracea]|nr:hypothetical protein SOVF_134340 [Spinacia oleracea]